MRHHLLIAMSCAYIRFGAAFFMDSGSSCGEIAGHAKVSLMWLIDRDEY